MFGDENANILSNQSTHIKTSLYALYLSHFLFVNYIFTKIEIGGRSQIEVSCFSLTFEVNTVSKSNNIVLLSSYHHLHTNKKHFLNFTKVNFKYTYSLLCSICRCYWWKCIGKRKLEKVSFSVWIPQYDELEDTWERYITG